jgi:hypothetical protein
VSEPVEDLRSTSDRVLETIGTLESLERQKRRLEPRDPRRRELAGRVAELARRLLAAATAERELTETVDGSVPGAHAIDETPREPAAILAEWRAAERRIAEAAFGSAPWQDARATIDRLRDEYRRRVERD